MEVQSPGPTNVVPQNTSTSCAIPSSSEVSSVAISKTSINLENMDKECSALAGLFQQTVNDMKVRFIFNVEFWQNYLFGTSSNLF